MNLNLGKHFDELIRNEVRSGRYQTASDFVRAALRQWEDDRIEELFVDELDQKLQEGLRSPRRKLGPGPESVNRLMRLLRRRPRGARESKAA